MQTIKQAYIARGNTHLDNGCSIGKGVAAGSVVTSNVELYTIVAGNPAKLVRQRFERLVI